MFSNSSSIRALSQNSSIIASSQIDLFVLTYSLFSAELISEADYKDVLDESEQSSQDRIHQLISIIKHGARSDESVFERFVRVLKEYNSSTSRVLAENLERSGSHTYPAQGQLQPEVKYTVSRASFFNEIIEFFNKKEDAVLDHFQSERLMYQDGEVCSSVDVLQDMLDAVATITEEETEELETWHDSICIEKSLSKVKAVGVMAKKSHHRVYSKLFEMVWSGQDDKAFRFVKKLRQMSSVSVDTKVVCVEVIHTVNNERDLKMLTSAIAYTNRKECENSQILKCRLYRRIAGLQYRNRNIEIAKEYLHTALQLADQISVDIDTVYTLRLQALILFEEYEKEEDEMACKGATKYFQLAMDHVRKLPEQFRLITERVKISKAQFHLDMINSLTDKRCENEIEEISCQAKKTLDDVDNMFLTKGDKAFFFRTNAKLKLLLQDHKGARQCAEKAKELDIECGFKDRAKEAEKILIELDKKQIATDD